MQFTVTDTYEIAVFAVCLCFSAFFSASETAITSLGSPCYEFGKNWEYRFG